MRTCTELGVCQGPRHDCNEACGWSYTHAPARGDCFARQYPFAPGVLVGYKPRQRNLLRKWMWRTVVMVAVVGFVSGFVRGVTL